MGQVVPFRQEQKAEANILPDDAVLAVNLSVGQWRDVIRQEIRAAIGSAGIGEERLLTAEDASAMLSVSVDWLYRNSKKLPFTRKLAPKMLRFSHQGILKWLATRRLS